MFCKRQFRIPIRARSALGVVLLAIVNLAFQPCAMAVEFESDHGCPHCPGEAQHDGHETDVSLSDVGSCDYLDIYSLDARSVDPQVKEPSGGSATIMPGFDHQAESAAPQYESGLDSTAVGYPGDPPFTIRYCVFLK